eukprot:gb/GFBE01058035.1/.p1 GENE.gb/GFBE01058035.1/~~gb/GFBE01058035.1/.p1  ORF type:complete len:883 (+),score=186.78 gb/GFBE01058035.1/:1-2649(+)
MDFGAEMSEEEQVLENRRILDRLQIRDGERFSFAKDQAEDAFTIANEHFVIKALLGEGSFGSVYRCTRTEPDGAEQDFAVKIVSTERISMMTGCCKEEVITRMLNEADILGCLGGHPNIVQLHLAAISPTSLRIFMVMQLLSCRDLFGEVVRRRQAFSEHDARQVTMQLALAITHCHRRRVAHRDIKLENVMLASRSPIVIKLIDFGQAKTLDEFYAGVQQGGASIYTTAKTLTTTHLYTPPDVKKAIQDNKDYDPFKLDAFGLGVILYGLLCNALPDAAKGDYEKRPSWQKLSAEAQDLVKKLLCEDPQQRLSLPEVLSHPWLSQSTGTSMQTSKAATPADYDNELQAILAAQALNKALQRERGASCWMLVSSDGASRWRWCCEATNEALQQSIEIMGRFSFSQAACTTVQEVADTLEPLREKARNLASKTEKCMEDFEIVFGHYCTFNEDVISAIAALLESLREVHGRSGRSSGLTCAELRLRMLFMIAEQLGRERAFISGHIGRLDWLRSRPVQMKLAKLQGCRQMLLGSTDPSRHCEVMSSSSGLLPGLRLMQESLVTSEDIASLEVAENTVMEGGGQASEWFALISQLIDKVHQHASMAAVQFIHAFDEQNTPLKGRQSHSAKSVSDVQLSSYAFQVRSQTSDSGSAYSPVSVQLSQASTSQELHTQKQSSPFGHSRQGSRWTPMQWIDHQRPILESEQSTLAPAQGWSGGMSSGSSSRAPAGHDHLDFSDSASSTDLVRLQPMKIVPSSLPCTPEVTPMHPGLWRTGFGPSAMQQPQLSEKAETAAAVVPPPPQPEGAVRPFIMSKGTVGHPDSCRGLGCKFSAKGRGCKEGPDCLRCHLCQWRRAPEKAAAANQQEQLQPVVPGQQKLEGMWFRC